MEDVKSTLRGYWEQDAPTYDSCASHSLSEPVEAEAWRAALCRHLPPPGARVLDAGAGAGALTLLAAGLGYRVTALDFSSAMLDQARRKAAIRGLDIEFVVGDVTEPPPGPFDAVIERHVLWTQPDPVAALSAWRRVAPRGRVVLYEAVPRRGTITRKVRDGLAQLARRALGVAHDHHAPYPDVLDELPLSRAGAVDPFLDALQAAGWRRYRAERLREIERARLLAGPPVVARLEAVPRFALLAE